MESRMTKRLTKDLEAIQKNYKDLFIVTLPNNDLKLWHIKFKGAPSSLYEKEEFTYFFLLFQGYNSDSRQIM